MRFPFVLLFAHVRKSWFRSLLTTLSVFVAMAILVSGFTERASRGINERCGFREQS